MVSELCGPSTLLWVQIQHQAEEGSDFLRRLPWKLVLVMQHVLKGPKAKLVDMPELACEWL